MPRYTATPHNFVKLLPFLQKRKQVYDIITMQVCIFSFQLLNHMNHIPSTWYEHYATGDQRNNYFSFLTFTITTKQTSEMGVT